MEQTLIKTMLPLCSKQMPSILAGSIILLLIFQTCLNVKLAQEDVKFPTRASWLETGQHTPLLPNCDICSLPNGTNITLPQIPSFIVAGAQKGGTTALYALLIRIPNVIKPLKVEPHFFDVVMPNDMIQNKKSISELSQQDLCRYRWLYYQYVFLNSTKDKIPLRSVFFEKTPKYLCFPDLAPTIKRMLPWVKIVIMIRNPIDRAYSEYKQKVWLGSRMKRSIANLTFENILEEELEVLRRNGVSKAPTLRQFALRGLSLHNMSHAEKSAHMADLFALPLQISHENRSITEINVMILGRGMYAQQLAPWVKLFGPSNRLLLLPFEDFQRDQATTLNKILAFVDATPSNLTERVLKKSYLPVKRLEKDPGNMSSTTREYLENLYRPYNEELADLMGEEWRNRWFR